MLREWIAAEMPEEEELKTDWKQPGRKWRCSSFR